MANPKRRHSTSRQNMRRSANWKLSAMNIGVCPQCKSARLPHQVCPECGFYDGVSVVRIKEKKPEEQKGK